MELFQIMALIILGGAFIKSVISATVARETTASTRAKGFAIFYGMVNIGAFSENDRKAFTGSHGERRSNQSELFFSLHDFTRFNCDLVFL